MPIHEGYALYHAILRLAGRDLTEDLWRSSLSQGSFNASAEREIVRDGSVYDTRRKSIAEIDQEENYDSFTASAEREIVRVDIFHCVEEKLQP